MENEPAVIEKQMEETRAAMNDKLEALESKVAETVSSTTDVVQTSTEAVSTSVENVKETVESSVEAVKETVAAVTDTVHDTVQAIKDTVQETVQTIKESFDISLQMQRHPWLIFGGAVGLGLLGSLMVPRRSKVSSSSAESSSTPAHSGNGSNGSSYTPPTFGPEAKRFSQLGNDGGSQSESTWESATGWVGEQIGRLKGLALGTVMGAVRDMAKRSLPESVGSRVAEEVDSITKGLGGEPIPGPVLAETK